MLHRLSPKPHLRRKLRWLHPHRHQRQHRLLKLLLRLSLRLRQNPRLPLFLPLILFQRRRHQSLCRKLRLRQPLLLPRQSLRAHRLWLRPSLLPDLRPGPPLRNRRALDRVAKVRRVVVPVHKIA